MNKKLIPLVIILIVTTLLAACSADFATVTFPSGAKVKCQLAVTMAEKADGLTIYDKLSPSQGMLFVYQHESEGLNFWMPAKMNFPIDMIFLNAEKQIVHIVRNAEPCTSNDPYECPTYGPPLSVTSQYVIEVVAGFCDQEDLALGDHLSFKLK